MAKDYSSGKNRPRSFSQRILRLAEAIPLRKQGKIIIAIISLLLVVAVGCTILSLISQDLGADVHTVTVNQYEYGEGCTVSGLIVRRERTMTSPQPITSLTLAEGQKVSKGETIAMSYTNAQAQARQQEINTLRDELSQLQYALSISGTTYDQASMDASIREALYNAAILENRGDYTDLSETSAQLKGLILRRCSDEGSNSDLQAQIDEKTRRLNEIQGNAAGQITYIAAPCAGYFSGTADGYEATLTPDNMSALSVSEIETLRPGALPAGAIGRVVTDDTWYFVAPIPEENLKDSAVGDTVTVRFTGSFTRDIFMKIHHIGQAEGSRCPVVFSCNHFAQNISLLRKQSADITFRTYTGVRVPKDSVRVKEDGSTGVFVLESRKAVWKPITVIYNLSDSYLVKLDKTSTANLWPGDELILDQKDLESGKVVIK